MPRPISMDEPPPASASDMVANLPPARIFGALLSDLRRSARRLARSGEDADDLVQETLLRVWSRMAMNDGIARDTAPIDDLRAYAFATLRHRAFARGSIAQPVDTEPDDMAAPTGSDASARMACAEALAALEDLPPEQSRLLKLRAMEGLSYAEIARKTGLPLGTVTSRMARGRATLRVVLDLPPGTPVSDLLGGS